MECPGPATTRGRRRSRELTGEPQPRESGISAGRLLTPDFGRWWVWPSRDFLRPGISWGTIAALGRDADSQSSPRVARCVPSYGVRATCECGGYATFLASRPSRRLTSPQPRPGVGGGLEGASRPQCCSFGRNWKALRSPEVARPCPPPRPSEAPSLRLPTPSHERKPTARPSSCSTGSSAPRSP